VASGAKLRKKMVNNNLFQLFLSFATKKVVIAMPATEGDVVNV